MADASGEGFRSAGQGFLDKEQPGDVVALFVGGEKLLQFARPRRRKGPEPAIGEQFGQHPPTRLEAVGPHDAAALRKPPYRGEYLVEDEPAQLEAERLLLPVRRTLQGQQREQVGPRALHGAVALGRSMHRFQLVARLRVEALDRQHLPPGPAGEVHAADIPGAPGQAAPGMGVLRMGVRRGHEVRQGRFLKVQLVQRKGDVGVDLDVVRSLQRAPPSRDGALDVAEVQSRAGQRVPALGLCGLQLSQGFQMADRARPVAPATRQPGKPLVRFHILRSNLEQTSPSGKRFGFPGKVLERAGQLPPWLGPGAADLREGLEVPHRVSRPTDSLQQLGQSLMTQGVVWPDRQRLSVGRDGPCHISRLCQHGAERLPTAGIRRRQVCKGPEVARRLGRLAGPMQQVGDPSMSFHRARMDEQHSPPGRELLLGDPDLLERPREQGPFLQLPSRPLG